MRLSRVACLVLLLAVVGCDSSGLADLEVGDLVLSVEADGVRLQTEEEYGCANYPLVIDADAAPRRTKIEVEGVGEISVCARAFGPAEAFVPFPENVEPVGHEIEIQKDGRTDRFDYTCGFAGCMLRPVGEPSFTRLGPR